MSNEDWSKGDGQAADVDASRAVQVPAPKQAGVQGPAIGAQPGFEGTPEAVFAALRVSEERFRALADNIAQLAWMADSSGWIFWYNKRWFDYTGTTLEHMQGWGWQQVHHPEHRDRVVEKIRHHFATGEAWEDLFPLRSRDGEYRWFLSRALPVCDDDGRLLCWFGTNTDVTEQREAEERLREADRRKDEFIAMLGHELRNPLAAIRSATDVLHGWLDPAPELKKALQVLERQSVHMARLVDGLLDVSRIAHGKIALNRVVLDLRPLVLLVVEDQKDFAAERRLRIATSLSDAPACVRGDSTRIAQVLENLLGNAIKFSREGGEIYISLKREGDALVLRVRDGGMGIRPELLGRIFQPFEQEVQEVARSAGGLGLGLAVARGLVELHGGSIEVDSGGAGLGAEFAVRLPAVDGEGPATDDVAEVIKPAVRRVLIVEDNVDAAAMMALLLRRRQHHVALAHHAADGLALLKRAPVDIVLCDLGLPGMSGLEFARAVRSDPALSQVRLIALTGYGQQDDVERSLEAGFDVHLTKPVDIAALEQVLR